MIRQNKAELVTQGWSLASSLLLASALIVVGICVYLLVFNTHKEIIRLVDTAYVAKNEAVFKNDNVSYPIIPNEKVTVMMRNYITHQIDEFLQKVGVKKNDPDTELTINYTIMHYDTHTMTIMFHKTEHVSGISDVRSQSLMTYDLQKQTQLRFVDIFKDTTQASMLLKRILHDYFQHRTSDSFTAAELGQLLRLKLEDIQEFVLDDDAVIIYINPRQPASSQGKVAISIKKDLLATALDDVFIPSSHSLTQRTIESPTHSIDTMPQHEVDPSAKMVALTFDDGPGNLTSSLLDVLRKYGAHATFFVIGRQVPPYASIVKREVTEGNEVGNHSWSHPRLTLLSRAGLEQQIGDTQRAIKEATGGYTPVLMRPPEAVFNNAVSSYLQSQGLSTQLWNVDTLDWLNRDSQVVYDRVLAGAADGRVILLHDIYPTSVDASARAIPELIAKGYQLVTVSELRRYR